MELLLLANYYYSERYSSRNLELLKIIICYLRKWEKKTFVDQTHNAHKRSHLGFFSNLKVFYLHVWNTNNLLENYISVLFCFASLFEQYLCAHNASNRAAINAVLKTKMYIEVSSAYNWPGKIKMCILFVCLSHTLCKEITERHWEAKMRSLV